MSLVGTLWTRWRITVAYLLIIASFLFTYYVKNDAADRRIEAACASVTQVKNAALSLTQPTPTQNVTDPALLQRIALSNAAKAAARKTLERSLACRR